MKLITCPQEAGPSLLEYRKKVFLAGGITGCPDWQAVAIEMLADQDKLLVMNPRRDDFDVSDLNMTKHQVDWEFRHINYANCMLFWFPRDTLCPITLFELGKIVGANRNLVVGAHPDYKRRIDLIEQLSHTHPHHTLHTTLESTVDDLKSFFSLPLGY